MLLGINEIDNGKGWRRSVENDVPLGINEIGNGGMVETLCGELCATRYKRDM